jgi:hypothetical protein
MLQEEIISSFEIGLGVGIVYLVYAIWRDLRNAFFR